MAETIGNVHSSSYASGIASIKEKLDTAHAEQGIFGKFWNGIKEVTNLGQSYSDCEGMLDKYKKGEISLDDAIAYIEDFQQKQKVMSNLLVNVATGTTAIAATVLTAGAAAPIGWKVAALQGAPIGAAVKVGLKVLDRKGNGIEGDEFDVKEMSRDAITGALTATTSAVSSGVSAGIRAGKFGLSVVNGAKCGAACGAAIGAGNYMTDVAFGEKKFKFGELAKTTAASSFVSSSVGALVGVGMYGAADVAGTVGSEASKSVAKQIATDSASSASRKILGQAERDIGTAVLSA